MKGHLSSYCEIEKTSTLKIKVINNVNVPRFVKLKGWGGDPVILFDNITKAGKMQVMH